MKKSIDLTKVQAIIRGFKESLANYEKSNHKKFEVIYFQTQANRYGHLWYEPTLISTLYDVEPEKILIILLNKPCSDFCLDLHRLAGIGYVQINDLAYAAEIFNLSSHTSTKEFKLSQKLLVFGNIHLLSHMYSSVLGSRRGHREVLKRSWFENYKDEVLSRLDIPQHKKIAILHVRDAGWTGPGYHDYRNANVDNYIDAIKLLESNEYCVVRIGDRTMPPLTYSSPNVVDLPHSGRFVDGDDAKLIAYASIYIGQTSGPYSLTVLLGVDTVLTNEPNPVFAGYVNDYEQSVLTITLFKTKLASKTGKKLSLFEHLVGPILFFASDYSNGGLCLVENTTLEIRDTVEEMLQRKAGKWDTRNDKRVHDFLEYCWCLGQLVRKNHFNLIRPEPGCFVSHVHLANLNGLLNVPAQYSLEPLVGLSLKGTVIPQRKLDQLKKQAKKLRTAGRLHEAKALYEKLLQSSENDPEVSLDIGDIYMKLEDFEAATRVYAKMLEERADNPLVLSNLGGALLRLGKPADARTMLEYAIELEPKNIYARINLGGVLQAQGELKKALENALEAVSIDPTHPLAFNNLGSAFSDLAMFAEAKHAFETAAMLDPSSIDALINLAGSQAKLQNHSEALDAYEKVLRMLGPHEEKRADAIRFFAGFEHQALGNLEQSWDGYECGFSQMIPTAGARSPNRQFKVPKWDGSDIAGKRLLVWREQGVGDEILYASIFHELETLGINVIFECELRLLTLWQRSFPEFNVRAASFDQNTMLPYFEDYDFHLPICSLGSLFRRTAESFNRFKPYIFPDPQLLEQYRGKLTSLSRGRPRVGVLWRSIKLTPNRVIAYTSPQDWEGILDRMDVFYVNLQYNLRESELEIIREKYGENLHIFPEIDLKDDFERTAALVANLDLVISPDTTMFELAGGLGIKTILMTTSPNGYYGKTDHFIFYPSVELIRSNHFGHGSAQAALRATASQLDRVLNSL